MNIKYFLLLPLVITQSCKSQENVNTESVKSVFLQEQKEFGSPIWSYLGSNFYTLNSLNETDFTFKIDSLKAIYTTHLKSYKKKLDRVTYNDETIGIDFAFDKYILEYPKQHRAFTGEEVLLSKKNQSKLVKNSLKFNDANLFSNRDFKHYVKSYISIVSRKKLEKHIYEKLNNQQLIADWNTIDSTFTNQEVNDYWKQEYLYYHIDNLGIKNIDNLYHDFMNTCKIPEYITKISEIYEVHKKGRVNHIIETYKEIDGFKLDMHLFLPNSKDYKGKRPTIVQFHGGSWSEGKPDWFFSTAEAYVKQGWVVGVVEYRIKGKQGTYPFESVKDAKSSMRWIRKNAKKYNIDSNKIIATGNSAGGHLSLAIALIDNWNESNDNLEISAKPNIIIINSGVYDLTTNSNRWITENYENRDIVKEISPNHLLKKSDVKMLLIHGAKDRNCPYETAEYFYNEMRSLGNDIKLHTVKDAEHMIWYGKHSTEVSKITSEYIKSLNF